MRKTNLLALSVLIAIGGLAMMSIANATEIIERLDNGHTYMGQTINTLTICDPVTGTECITMMDRNLGATTNDITSTGSYGYHYQWGNNHGFSPYESVTSGTQQIDCTSYDPLHPLNSNIFIKDNADFCLARNDNMRGGANDSDSNDYGYPVTNASERKGPCPDGYHVPSEGEWNRLLNMRIATYTGEINGSEVSILSYYADYTDNVLGVNFGRDFKIPFAGSRDYYASVDYLGDDASLWSSSPDVGNWSPFYFILTTEVAGAYDYTIPANAFSVRCFKDSAMTFSQTMDIYETMDIYVTVDGGNLTIGIGSGNGTLEKNLGTIGISNTAQEVSGSFGTGYFRVEDMKGLESGYYTTLSVTDLIGENNENHIISGENVYFIPSGLTVVSSGSASVVDSQVVIGSGNARNDWRSPSESPITYINRMNTPMADAGRIGKWGDDLQVKVVIPANTLMDTYRGTITYTLYEL